MPTPDTKAQELAAFCRALRAWGGIETGLFISGWLGRAVAPVFASCDAYLAGQHAAREYKEAAPATPPAPRFNDTTTTGTAADVVVVSGLVNGGPPTDAPDVVRGALAVVDARRVAGETGGGGESASGG